MDMIQGEVPTRFWRSGKQFLLSAEGLVWEKETGNCYVWSSTGGEYQRDATIPSVRWVDLVKDRFPVITITPVEAIAILTMRRVEEVARNAESAKPQKFVIDNSRGFDQYGD